MVEPILSGVSAGDARPDDVEYARDLGLVTRRGARLTPRTRHRGRGWHRGGRIEREYALGSRRTDLLIVWPPGRFSGAAEPGAPARRYVVECKLLRGSLKATIREGLEQTLAYVDKCGGESGHLVVFDRDESKPWEEKIFRLDESLDGRAVTVWGA